MSESQPVRFRTITAEDWRRSLRVARARRAERLAAVRTKIAAATGALLGTKREGSL
jgi:hypothetical protein